MKIPKKKQIFVTYFRTYKKVQRKTAINQQIQKELQKKLDEKRHVSKWEDILKLKFQVNIITYQGYV